MAQSAALLANCIQNVPYNTHRDTFLFICIERAKQASSTRPSSCASEAQKLVHVNGL